MVYITCKVVQIFVFIKSMFLNGGTCVTVIFNFYIPEIWSYGYENCNQILEILIKADGCE